MGEKLKLGTNNLRTLMILKEKIYLRGVSGEFMHWIVGDVLNRNLEVNIRKVDGRITGCIHDFLDKFMK